jgi:hypothetical protein
VFPASPTRRTLLRGALGLGAATALTACGGGSTTARTSGDVTLSLWTHDPGYEDFFRKGIPEADRLTDFRYHVDVTRAGPADLVTKLLAQAVAGRGTPDAIGFEIGSFPRMLRGDIAPRLLHDLTPGIAAVPGLKDDLLPARLAPYSKDGRLYALDSDTPMVVYYYRDDLFSQWNLPTDTATWEEYAELGARVHKDHGASLCVVSTVGSDTGQVVQSFQMLLHQRGGAFFDADGNLVLDSPEAEETLRFLCEGLRTGFVIDISDYYGAAMLTARLLFGVMFSSLSVPFAVILVPLFVILVKSGLGSPWFALIVPWVAPAFGIFMMQQYIVQSVPDSVLEAARIDGASEFGIFRTIVLPLLRPSLGALAVWQFLQSYNSFLWPLVLVSDSSQYTLPLGLQTLFVSEQRQYDLVLAGAVIAVVPAVALFVVLRKQLLEGLSTGAVKG